MVAVAISAVIVMAFLGMFNGILKTQKYVTQRYEIQDLSSLVRLGMMQSNFCSCNFPNALDFSSGTVPVSSLKYFDPATCATSTGLLVSSNTPNDNLVPGSTTGLRVKQMQMQNMKLLSSPTPATNYYSFDIQIDFDPSTTAIQVKPALITGLTMITDATSAPMQKISSCEIGRAHV